jgi:hypothetical protein
MALRAFFPGHNPGRRQWQQQSNGKDNGKQTTARAKYRGLSTARQTMVPSAASVEMTSLFWVWIVGATARFSASRIAGQRPGRRAG